MHAMLSTAPGGPETLQWSAQDCPQPGAQEVLVKIHAASVNYPDTLMIQDLYQIKPPRPFAPGGEIAGEIIALGPEVQGHKIGDRVLALTGYGGFATHIAIPAASAIRIPDQMSDLDAAGFVFTYGTSHHALKERANLQSGETVLVLGAAGGVGSAAVELAKAAGARVIAAVSSAEKAAFCQEIGADATVIYGHAPDKEDQISFGKNIKALAGKAGVDVVYDAVGGPYAEPALRAIGWQGRYLVIGFAAGIPKIPMNLPLLKGCQIVGVFWGAAVQRDPVQHLRNVEELFELYRSGKIRPRVHAAYPMSDAATALTEMQSRSVLGKVILTNTPE
ncbi:NADPH:quinone oxidoreductase family protein [Phaeobacter piscinae]|uniref:NADPH:quinone oxidoreductase family protein n=1 Tax=Phaeobacter piscinae TaxID=1580596 RepID=UPI00058AEA48|nr:NADPH:quinone oxidoreductase family protein [Phaeobacter piscinae]UTS80551.1 Phthiocerol synthesis polyketide synthase type I PpsC [Phaeobacter piscinae]